MSAPRTIIVTGGSRGLGLGIASARLAQLDNLIPLEQRQRALPAFGERHAVVAFHGFGDLIADLIDRIEGEAGVLEDHRHGTPAKSGEFARRHCQHIAAVDRDAAADPRGAWMQPQQRAQGHALA